VVRLRNGQLVREDEPILVAVGAELREVPVTRLKSGDWVAQPYGRHSWSEDPAEMPWLALSPMYGSQKRIDLPATVSVELARFLGAYVAEGHTARSTWSVVVTNSVTSVLELISDDAASVFGVIARIVQPGTRCPAAVFASKTLVEILDGLECGRRANEKRIPAVIFEGRRDAAVAFLSGLALDAYTTEPQPKWAICLDSPGALDDIQLLLRWLGIVSNRVSKFNTVYDKAYGEVVVHGRQAQSLVRLVPFLEPDKQGRAARLLVRPYQQSPMDVVPIISGRDLYESLPLGRPGRSGRGSGRSRWAILRDPRTRHVSRTTIEAMAAAGTVLPDVLHQVLEEGLHFSRVDCV
jgi:intein/homing endonuclease